MKITSEMTIEKILKIRPAAGGVLVDFGLGCTDCHLGSVETLKEGARGHGLADSEIEELVQQINYL